jgi:hypothetical protein
MGLRSKVGNSERTCMHIPQWHTSRSAPATARCRPPNFLSHETILDPRGCTGRGRGVRARYTASVRVRKGVARAHATADSGVTRLTDRARRVRRTSVEPDFRCKQTGASVTALAWASVALTAFRGARRLAVAGPRPFVRYYDSHMFVM